MATLTPVISLPSYALSCSESPNASNTSSSHLPTKFPQLLNLSTFMTSSLFNTLAELALNPSLLLLDHRNHPVYWSLLSLSFTLSLKSTPFISSSTSFWYQFLHFRLTCSFTRSFFLFWFTTLLIPYSLAFIPDLKPTCFTNSTPVVSLLPPRLPSQTIAWTISSELLVSYHIVATLTCLSCSVHNTGWGGGRVTRLPSQAPTVESVVTMTKVNGIGQNLNHLPSPKPINQSLTMYIDDS